MTEVFIFMGLAIAFFPIGMFVGWRIGDYIRARRG